MTPSCPVPILRESLQSGPVFTSTTMNCCLRTATCLSLLLALPIFAPAFADEALGNQPPGIIDLTPQPSVPDDSGFPEKDLKTDTAIYKGRFKVEENGQITGSVDIEWKNGDRFEGHLLHGRRIGPGRFRGADGQLSEGNWEDDQLQGRGRLHYANGDEYVGDLSAGLPDGVGSFTETNGDHYEGGWKAGHKDGYGTYTWNNGQIYSGDWAEDQATGQGTLTQANGNRYVGGVRNGHPDGRGSLSFAESGDQYEGTFENGLPDGHGVYTWKNGDHYDGPWKMGQKSGFGRYIWADGDYWEGNFVDDQQTDGRMYFTPHIAVTGQEIRELLEQTRSTLNTSPSTTEDENDLSPDALKNIPMVEAMLQSCQGKADEAGCREQILQKIIGDQEFQQSWQLLTRDGSDGSDSSRFEVDRHAILDEGNVFTWLRFSASDSARSLKAGIKYNCETRSIDIQLVYRCLGSQDMPLCTLDQNFAAYVGKPVPATPITSWFESACKRRFGDRANTDETKSE